MNLTKITVTSFGFAGIATATLLDAAPSKAVLFIDFIPLSPTQTRIQASGTINPSLLGTSSSGSIALAPTPPNSSRISTNVDELRFNYNSVSSNPAGRRYAIAGNTNPFTATGPNTSWSGTTPINNPPLMLRFGSNMDFWLPNTFTGGASPVNQNNPLNGFFDVNLSLAQIGLSGPIIAFTSGSEQIILRNNPQTSGPLPLLGAAAAFGYSRKLRNRIQKSTPSRTA
jgi:hypothetical protein